MKLRRSRLAAPDTAAPETPCLGCSDKLGRPFAVSPVKGRSAELTDVVVPAECLMAAVDGNLVAFLIGSGQGVLLNASAALIFTAFDGERPVSQIIEQLADETGMEAALLASDVRATVDRLLAQGIVTLAADGRERQPDRPGWDVAALDPARWRTVIDRLLAAVPWSIDRASIPIIGTTCGVRADDERVSALLGPLLPSAAGPEAADAPASAHQLSIVSRKRGGEPHFRVVLDGRVVAHLGSPEWAVVHALHALDELAVDGTTDALLFHAGAVERDGQVVIVLGISGKGKSTLTAALVQHGFRYLSDEVAAVSPGDLSVLPYPKALDLDPVSLELLGVGSPDASLGSHKDKVLPQTLGEVSVGGTPALIVFLAETLTVPGQPGVAPVERVPPAEALVALLPVTFEQTIANPDHFGAMAELCERVPAIRIGRAPLAATIAAIETALEAEGASRHQGSDAMMPGCEPP